MRSGPGAACDLSLVQWKRGPVRFAELHPPGAGDRPPVFFNEELGASCGPCGFMEEGSSRRGCTKEKRPRQNRRRSVEFPLTRELVYFFFFAGAFFVAFLAVAFLVAFFIQKILPKRKICNLYRSQCDSYIRLFAREVKKKISKTWIRRARQGIFRSKT